jgi:hypothetical protein
MTHVCRKPPAALARLTPTTGSSTCENGYS